MRILGTGVYVDDKEKKRDIHGEKNILVMEMKERTLEKTGRTTNWT